MFTDGNGFFYNGDCRVGDRDATQNEIADWMQACGDIVPASVTKFQAKVALAHAGLLDAIETYMQTASTPIEQRLAWTESQDFLRNSNTVALLPPLFNLTSEQVDALFVDASKVKA